MKRLFALLLSLALVCGALPVNAALPVAAAAYAAPAGELSAVTPGGAGAATAENAAEAENFVQAVPAEDTPPAAPAAAKEQTVPAAPHTATLRVELYDDTYQMPVTITLPAQYKPLADYGLSVKNDPRYFTPLHLLAEYCLALGLEPKDAIEVSSTGFVSDFLSLKGTNCLPDAYGQPLTDTSFMFAVNDTFPQRENGVGYTLADYPLTEGDTVVLYDMWYSSETICGNYAWFASTAQDGYAGDAVPFVLHGFSGMTGKAASMQGATLLVYDENGDLLPASAATSTTVEADGTAQITFVAPGSYRISAARLSGYYHNWPFTYAQDISRPYCLVTVTEAPLMTDAEAVAYAKKALSLGNLSAVTQSLSLPGTGLRGTTVSWATDSPTIAADGTITRPGYGAPDAAVTLTATITRGTASDTKTFAATVQALTKAEAETALEAAVRSVYVSTSLSATGPNNLVKIWQQKLATAGHPEIAVTIQASENPNIDAAGNITFNQYYNKNYVTVRFAAGGVFWDKQEQYTVNTVSLTVQQRVDTVAELLNFDSIKGTNTDPNFITKSPTRLSSMTGYSGVKISWASSDSTAISVGSYSITVRRPALGAADKPVALTATVTASGATAKTAQIPLVVPAYTTELEELSVSEGALAFDKTRREYTLHLPQNATALAVTAKPRDTAVIKLGIGGERFSSNGNKVQSVTIALTAAVTTIPVVVTCSGSEETTTLTVVRDVPTAPDLGAFWGSYRKAGDGNAVITSGQTPAQAAETTLRWQSSVKQAGALTSYAGSPILVDGKVYLARENTLLVLDAATGAECGAVPLSGKTGYVSLVAYGDGQIFVPLAGGVVECIDAATLASLWVSEPLGNATMQALSPVAYLNGKIFCGFYDYTSDSGTIGVIDPAQAPTGTGAKRWVKTFGTAGCYGSGVIAAGQYLVLADEAGTVRLLGSDTAELATFTVDDAVRSLPVYAEGAVYLTTTRGTLYRFVVEGGTLRCTGQALLPASSVAAPVVANGTVFVVGGSFGGIGYCAALDADTLAPVATLQTDGPIQSSPAAVQTEKGSVLLYCAENTVAGWLLCITYRNRQLNAQTLYTPATGNYTTSSPVITADGTVLYATDGGTLFALGKTAAPAPGPAATPVPTAPAPGPTVTPVPTAPVPGPATTPVPTAPAPGPATTPVPTAPAAPAATATAPPTVAPTPAATSLPLLAPALVQGKAKTHTTPASSATPAPQATATPTPTASTAATPTASTAATPTASTAPAEQPSPDVAALRTALAGGVAYCIRPWAAEQEIPAEMFALLATAKDCTLVLDYGAYTISFSSGTVKAGTGPVQLSLGKTTLSTAMSAKFLPGAAAFTLETKGALPGPATVVCLLADVGNAENTGNASDEITTGTALFAIQGGEPGAPQAVTVQDGCALFTLDAPGSFVLGRVAEPVATPTVWASSTIVSVLEFCGIAAVLLLALLILKKRGDRK